MKVGVVVNPNSANGKTRKEWKDIEKEIRKYFSDVIVKFTERQYHAVSLTKDLILKENVDMVIAVGGDGTLNEVINGFFDHNTEEVYKKEVSLGIIARGTGCDFIKTFNIPKDYREAIRILALGREKSVDVGVARFIDYEKKRAKRFFINIADVGIGGETVAIVNRLSKRWGGFLSFLFGTMLAQLRYRDKYVKYKIDNVEGEGKFHSIVIANGKFFGGGMKVAPQAEVDDGFFDVILVESRNRLEILMKFSKVYKGTHLEEDGIKFFRAKSVSLSSKSLVLIDIDGEQPGVLPVKFHVKEKAIKIRVPE